MSANSDPKMETQRNSRLPVDPEDQRELSRLGGHASRGGHGGHSEAWQKDGGESFRRHIGKRKLKVGFAVMDPERQRSIAAKGGRHSHDNDTKQRKSSEKS